MLQHKTSPLRQDKEIDANENRAHGHTPHVCSIAKCEDHSANHAFLNSIGIYMHEAISTMMILSPSLDLLIIFDDFHFHTFIV